MGQKSVLIWEPPAERWCQGVKCQPESWLPRRMVVMLHAGTWVDWLNESLLVGGRTPRTGILPKPVFSTRWESGTQCEQVISPRKSPELSILAQGMHCMLLSLSPFDKPNPLVQCFFSTVYIKLLVTRLLPWIIWKVLISRKPHLAVSVLGYLGWWAFKRSFFRCC